MIFNAFFYLILPFIIFSFVIMLFWGGFQRLLVYQQRWNNTLFSSNYPIFIIILLLLPMLGWVIPPLGSLLRMSLVSSLYSVLVVGLMLITYFENLTNKSYFPFLFTCFVLVSLSFVGIIGLVFYAFISLYSFFSWRSVVQNGRYYSALAVSKKIATTAQGTTVITGQVSTQGVLFKGEVSDLKVIWYRSYHLRPKPGDSLGFKTSRKEEGTDTPFLIDDGSGKCYISPKDARFYLSTDTLHVEDLIKVSGDYEVFLEQGQTVYAYGDFRTGSMSVIPDIESKTEKILQQWRRIPNYLYKKFDLDNNGKLDEKELQLARSSAQRLAKDMLGEELTQAATKHYMGRDNNKKCCIITDLSPPDIAARCQKVAWFHLAIFFLTWPSILHTLYVLYFMFK